MRSKFIGYYEASEEVFEESWTEGVFAFDANTLLNLYRYSGDTSQEMLTVIGSLTSRVHLPYQAALEFMNNRVAVISDSKRAYEELSKITASVIKSELGKKLTIFKRHPLIKIEKIQELYEEFDRNVQHELEVQKSSHPDLIKEDYILEKINRIFEHSTGTEPSNAVLDKIFAEGLVRYKLNVPPGFADAKGKESRPLREQYGDLIIWKELIEFCKSKNKPIIFITDDNKDDWWTKQADGSKRPRPELIKEFHEKTGKRILIYNSDEFIRIAENRNLVKSVKDETLNEIEDIRVFSGVTNSWESLWQSSDSAAYASALQTISGAMSLPEKTNEEISAFKKAVDAIRSYQNLLNNDDNPDAGSV